MTTNFMVKIGPPTFICRLCIPKRIGLSQFWFYRVRWQLSTSFVNLMRFGP